jgi:hypothetical protein
MAALAAALRVGGGSIGGHGQVPSHGTYTRALWKSRGAAVTQTHTRLLKNQYKNIKVENKGSTQQPTVTVIYRYSTQRHLTTRFDEVDPLRKGNKMSTFFYLISDRSTNNMRI